ncbi:MAG TPA: C25 family cysteine peptidase [Phycisphaerae bacterium]|nr:C25 family cysteine peptidase [Phycisphaerae bacterium]HNU46673.1 C25 family cysteine peptidase [Phycisphaerae bacterium]
MKLNVACRMGAWVVVGCCLLGVPATAAYGAWVVPSVHGGAQVEEDGLAASPQTTVVQIDDFGLRARVDLSGVGLVPRETPAGAFVEVSWPDASVLGAVGSPALPVVRHLIVAPAEGPVTVGVEAGVPVVLDLDAVADGLGVLPVQPPIEKIPGAREAAEFVWDEGAYAVDAELPSARAVIEELGVVRGRRLFLLEVRPVAYNPVAQTLTVWPSLEVDVQFGAAVRGEEELSCLPGLQHVALNPAHLGGEPRGTGNYLIIVADVYQSAIASFATAKANQGFTVSTYAVPAGTTNTAIKSYIQSLWGGSSAPAYILLVGDTDRIPYWTGGGAGTPATDLPYGCMDGSSDWYPDIAVGRFPVRSTTAVANVVAKTLSVADYNFADPDYVLRAVFMASSDNYTVSEGTHNYVISNYLIPAGFYCQKLYCHTYGATTQQVRDAFNNGRLYGVYSGHGSETSWGDGPAFYQSDVNGLTNANLYTFISSFSCLTGSFHVTECFTETWVLAPNKGAVTAVGSSVNSYWTEDDVLEKKLFQVIYADGIREIGPCWNAAKMRYLTEMGSGSTTRRYFEMYNLMGDPGLSIPEPVPPSGMQVTPTTELNAAGPYGGPFAPSSIVYTVTNIGNTGLDYAVTKSADWLSVSTSGGYLAAHATVQVTVALAAGASSLPYGSYADAVAFTNLTTHEGDALRNVTLKVGQAALQYQWTMDSNPGWSTEGQWAFGQPLGGGSHNLDPTAGKTGVNVYGYNLAGDYANFMAGTEYLTTAAINCARLAEVELRFWRRLGVERQPFDGAIVEISTDGSQWTRLWQNGTTTISEAAWSQQTFDLSAYADGRPAVYLRWGMGPTDGTVTYPGWNIDDVEIWGAYTGPAVISLVSSEPPDGAIDARQPLSPATLEQQGWQTVTMVFDGSADGLTPTDFAVTEVCYAGNCDGVAPEVAGVASAGASATVTLNRPLDPKAWTIIALTGGAPTDRVRLGFLPGDADGSRTANAGDVVQVINHINQAQGGGTPALYQSDINRSGAVNVTDMLTLINLLNGVAPYAEAYFGAQLPSLP